jgi:hypothetical protein
MAINAGSVANNLLHTINKLRIIQVEDVEGGSGGLSFGNVVGANLNTLLKMFEVQINPDQYTREYKIIYTTPEAVNGKTPAPAFNRFGEEMLSITFTLDGTGVIPSSATDLTNFATDVGFQALNAVTGLAGVGVNDVTYVTRRIEELKKVVYTFNNTDHQPPIVKVLWGDVQPFTGKLEDLKITYKLFHPSGAPLRADIQLQFKYCDSQSTSGNVAGAIGAAAGLGASIAGALLSSPDLTHRRTVKATDTLPLLCGDIYRDASFYWQVAEANNLTHFRELEVGSELLFPPIER